VLFPLERRLLCFNLANKLKAFGVLAAGEVDIPLETRTIKANFKSGIIIVLYLLTISYLQY